MRLVLADKSAWEQRRHNRDADDTMRRLAYDNRLAVCDIVALELLYSARNSADYETGRRGLESLVWLDSSDAVGALARSIQRDLAAVGQHRRPIPDLLIAATAIVHDAAVLHYDKDYDLIAQSTGLRAAWIVPRGTGHTRG